MADVEDPNGGDTVEAEPTECSRCMLIWVMPFIFLTFAAVSMYTVDFHEYHAPSKALDAAADLVGVLALIVAGWSALVFAMLVAEWYSGNPEGERAVDSLIQSERGLIKESFHQYIHRISAED